MGRVKKSKAECKKRNLNKVLTRWTNSEKSRNNQITNEEGKPNLESGPSTSLIPMPSKSCFSSNSSSSNTLDNPSNKPTGFALYSSYNEHIELNKDGPQYGLVDLTVLKDFLAQFPCCNCYCETLEVNSLESKTVFANTIEITCSTCSHKNTLRTSSCLSNTNSPKKLYDVNRRVVKAFTSFGKGHRALDIFCMTMNMRPMTFQSYYSHIKALHKAGRQEVDLSLVNARNEVRKCYCEIDDTRGVIDVTVSYDGTWQKRGFTSKYGIGCVIEVLSGLVIDFEVLSKFCNQCEKMKRKNKSRPEAFQDWYSNHKLSCNQNYVGSSPGMEVEVAERLWSRSESLGFRYTTMVSDGDAKTLTQLNNMEIYGDTKIEKVECLNHVAKRLGTGLRNLVKDSVGTNEPLGGRTRGNLSEPVIKKITAYYHNAIRKNIGDVKKMKSAIFATLSHCKSTDQNPQHHNCPKGKDSWCFFQRAIAENRPAEPHKDRIKTPLLESTAAKMIPLYTRLSSEALLTRCLPARTQNANEALHNVIWSKCSKNVYASKIKLEIGLFEAISLYNTGYLKLCSNYQENTGIKLGRFSTSIAKKFDKSRLRLAEARKKEKNKVYRQKLKQAQLEEEERLKEKEGQMYGAGEL